MGRVRRVALICLLVLLGVPAAASAALSPCAGPTGTAAINQYCETIPGAGGPKPVASGPKPVAGGPKPVAGHPIPRAPGSPPRGSVTPGSRPRPRTGSAGEKPPVRSHPARSHRRHASGGAATRGAGGPGAGGPGAGTPGTSPARGVIPATKSSIAQGEEYGGPLFWLLVASGVLAGLFALVRWRRGQRTSAPPR